MEAGKASGGGGAYAFFPDFGCKRYWSSKFRLQGLGAAKGRAAGRGNPISLLALLLPTAVTLQAAVSAVPI